MNLIIIDNLNSPHQSQLLFLNNPITVWQQINKSKPNYIIPGLKQPWPYDGTPSS